MLDQTPFLRFELLGSLIKPIAEHQPWTIRVTLSLGRIAEMNAERYAAWSVKRYGMEGLPEETRPTNSGAT